MLMRLLQITLLWAALICFLASLLDMLGVGGLIHWRAGIALLAIDVVLILLWPTKPFGLHAKEDAAATTPPAEAGQ